MVYLVELVALYIISRVRDTRGIVTKMSLDVISNPLPVTIFLDIKSVLQKRPKKYKKRFLKCFNL